MSAHNFVLWAVKISIELVWTIGLIIFGVVEGCVRFFYAPHKNLENEVVVLTGAAGGIGCRLAEKMAKKGESYVQQRIRIFNLY